MTAPEQNQAARETLRAYLRAGSLPHALLVEGGAEASFAFAREIAQGAMCTGGGEEPCGVCRDCVKNLKQIHPDVLVYGGEGGARSFHIDIVRTLRQEAYVRPGEASCKAMILRGVQNMSVQAQNALLKIIEEPPRGAVFILTCENRAALLETILSRVAVLSLEAVAAEEPYPAEAVQLLLNLSVGIELDALAALCAFERDREGLARMLRELRGVTVGILLKKPDLPEAAKRLQSRTTSLQMSEILAIIDETAEGLAGNVGGLLLCTALCAKIRFALEAG